MLNVVVTGGSRGIGLAIARRLAGAGYQVIAVARTSGDALETAIAEAARAERGRIHFVSQDLADIAGLQGLARGLKRDFGRIYGLVNNAAIGTSGVLASMPEAEIERLARMNVVSPLVLTKYLLSSMMAARRGRIVNISSIVALTGYRGIAGYSASKAAMLGFTRSLAREVGSIGITVNAVLPGFVSTDMTGELDAGARDRIARRSALGRLPDADDIAAAVEYLLGDGAANVTGTSLVVDAGAVA